METLVLFASILLALSSLLYLGEGANETQLILASARNGAENALSRLQWQYGGAARLKEVKIARGKVKISVVVWGLNCPEGLVKEEVRNDALAFMWRVVGRASPSPVQPLQTSRGVYDVEVSVEVVKR